MAEPEAARGLKGNTGDLYSSMVSPAPQRRGDPIGVPQTSSLEVRPS